MCKIYLADIQIEILNKDNNEDYFVTYNIPPIMRDIR